MSTPFDMEKPQHYLGPETVDKRKEREREKCGDVGLAEVDLRKLICLLACPSAVLSYV
jgi:hypothetical protein